MNQLEAMGYYDDRGPTHAHRTPAELAEDEILAALRGTLRQPFWRAGSPFDEGRTKRQTEVIDLPRAGTTPADRKGTDR